jgi:uroporphyrinogen-III synthase
MRAIGPRRVWVTRTQPRADATARRLAEMGLEPVVAPVLIARAVAADIDLADIAALAFTSVAGVRAFADASPDRGLPVLAVGGATAEAARAAGFAHVLASKGDVDALADLIAAARPAVVLAPTAREPAADLPALLAARGVAARSVVVYETVPTGSVVPADIDSVLIHSPRAARIVADLISADRANALAAYAISEAAAAPMRALPFAHLVVAPFPDEASLLHLLQG